MTFKVLNSIKKKAKEYNHNKKIFFENPKNFNKQK